MPTTTTCRAPLSWSPRRGTLEVPRGSFARWQARSLRASERRGARAAVEPSAAAVRREAARDVEVGARLRDAEGHQLAAAHAAPARDARIARAAINRAAAPVVPRPAVVAERRARPGLTGRTPGSAGGARVSACQDVAASVGRRPAREPQLGARHRSAGEPRAAAVALHPCAGRVGHGVVAAGAVRRARAATALEEVAAAVGDGSLLDAQERAGLWHARCEARAALARRAADAARLAGRARPAIERVEAPVIRGPAGEPDRGAGGRDAGLLAVIEVAALARRGARAAVNRCPAGAPVARRPAVEALLRAGHRRARGDAADVRCHGPARLAGRAAPAVDVVP